MIERRLICRAQIITLNSVVTREADNRLPHPRAVCRRFRDSFRPGRGSQPRVHIKYTGRKYKRVVALLDEHYDELWVGARQVTSSAESLKRRRIDHLCAASAINFRDARPPDRKVRYAPLDRVREMVPALNPNCRITWRWLLICPCLIRREAR